MDRRLFLALSASALALPAGLARAGEPLLYTPGLAEKAMDEGRLVLLDFWASWCSTCAAQERALTALKAANPAYEEAITFIKVDWDEHGKGALAQSLNIPRRSTLVALKGRQEIGRLVAETGRERIRDLLDRALAVA